MAAGVAALRLGGEGRLVQISRWEMMLWGTGARSAPGFLQHPRRAELAGTLPVGSVRWLTSKGSPTSSHNIYFPSLDLSQRHKYRANTVGHFLLRFGSTVLFPGLALLRISPLPRSATPSLGIQWQFSKKQTNLSKGKPLISSETSMSCCLAFGQ